jgi:hypothetical protein
MYGPAWSCGIEAALPMLLVSSSRPVRVPFTLLHDGIPYWNQFNSWSLKETCFAEDKTPHLPPLPRLQKERRSRSEESILRTATAIWPKIAKNHSSNRETKMARLNTPAVNMA